MRTLALITSLLLCCTTLHAEDLLAPDGRAFDPASGRDTRNYPPDPQVQFQHIALDLRMPDPMNRSFTCTETITFRTPQRLKPKFFGPQSGNPAPWRVGFGRHFGVKLAVLWAVESGLPLISDGSKQLKSLRKLTRKGRATNVMHITWFDPECI